MEREKRIIIIKKENVIAHMYLNIWKLENT